MRSDAFDQQRELRMKEGEEGGLRVRVGVRGNDKGRWRRRRRDDDDGDSGGVMTTVIVASCHILVRQEARFLFFLCAV